MKRVIDRDGQYVICRKASGLSRSLKGACRIVHESTGVLVFEVGSAEDVPAQMVHERTDGLRCYFERYTLEESANPAEMEALVSVFFDWLAPRYDSVIDIDRNIDNIDRLLATLREIAIDTQRGPYVDYGCGSGLSVYAALFSEFSILGIDSSDGMRKLARRRGLVAEGVEALVAIPDGSIAGAFCSYTFHLFPGISGLDLLWDKLMVGGGLVGNIFHREMEDAIVQHFLEMGAIVTSFSCSGSAWNHGPYYIFVKGQ